MQFYGDPMFMVSTRSDVYLNLMDLNSIQSLPVRETIVNLKIGVVLQDQNTVSKRDLERICGGHIPTPVFDKIKNKIPEKYPSTRSPIRNFFGKLE
jgi:hypothetical protein